MVDRKDIIKDLQRVDEETDSVVDPNQYGFLGEYKFEDIIDNFGTWQEALDNAEISLKNKIAADVMKINREIDGSIGQTEYRKKGKYPSTKIRQEYGTWNELKKSLGLNIHERRVSDQDLAEDMKRVAEEIGHPITVGDYNELGRYSSGVFLLRDYTFAEFRDEIGLEKPKSRAYPSKDALKAWKQELKEVKSRFSVPELKDRLSSTGYDFSTAYRKSLQEYLQENGFQFSVSSGSGSKYYIKGPEAPTLEEYYEKFLDKIPDDKEDWFMEMSGTGVSPKSIVAAIRYLTEDKTQREIAEEENVTDVSVRDTKSKIIERFNLDSDAGKDISKDEDKKQDSKTQGKEDTGENVESENKEIFSSLFFNDFLSLLNYEIVGVDQGKEFPVIFTFKNNEKILFVLELDQDKSNIDCVRAAEDIISSYDADKAVVISNSFFKVRARNVAGRKEKIELWDRQKVAEKNKSKKSIPEEVPDNIKVPKKSIESGSKDSTSESEENQKRQNIEDSESKVEASATEENKDQDQEKEISSEEAEQVEKIEELENYGELEGQEEEIFGLFLEENEPLMISDIINRIGAEQDVVRQSLDSLMDKGFIEKVDYQDEILNYYKLSTKVKNQLSGEIKNPEEIPEENSVNDNSNIEKTEDDGFFYDFLSVLNYELIEVDRSKDFPILVTFKENRKILFILELDQDKSSIDCISAAEDIISSYGAHKAIVISNSFFKVIARNSADRKENIELWNREDIAEKNQTKKSIPEETPEEIKILSKSIAEGNQYSKKEIERALHYRFTSPIKEVNRIIGENGYLESIVIFSEDERFNDALGSSRFTYWSELQNGDYETAYNKGLIRSMVEDIPVYFFHKEESDDEWDYLGKIEVVGVNREQDRDGRTNYKFEFEKLQNSTN